LAAGVGAHFDVNRLLNIGIHGHIFSRIHLAVTVSAMVSRTMSTPSTPNPAKAIEPEAFANEEAVAPSLLTGVQLNDPQVRALRFAVIGMGILIVLGLIALIGRIIYIVARPGPQIASQSSTIAPEVRASLPAGAHIRTVAVQGDRLAIHYDDPAGSGIAIVDLAIGRVVSRVLIVPDSPK
jgi:hypothetical protein